MHKSITVDRIIDMVEDGDSVGLCTACGAERYECEPDARNYECENCGAKQVFGAEELLLMVA